MSILAFAALLVTTAASGSSAAEVDSDLTAFGARDADQQRAESDPTLVKLPEPQPRAAVPQDRYAMAGGCYALQAPDGRWVVKNDSYAATGTDIAAAAPIHFQATELGVYLLFDADRKFIARSGGVSAADEPSEDAEWAITKDSGAFQIGSGPNAMSVGSDGSIGTGDASNFSLLRTEGCAPWPEAEVNVTGQTFAGLSAIQEVRGYLDDHIHHMTPGFLGGGIHCGTPWAKYGVEYALKDCADHETADGQAALPEIVLSGKTRHDPTGWPTFKDWPAPDSLTHEGTYYKWVERAWRGGQRMFVNLLVENSVLCQIYPGPNKTKCNDMDTIRTQAKESHEFENYVDAQWGGPGKGWYRIVDTPAEARKVINDGKMAVVLGTESSNLFGCSNLLDQPQCTESQIDAGLDELYELGIRQMVPTHKFDNAFAGAKGDNGFNGMATNVGTFIQNGSFFDMKTCAEGEPTDNTQLNATEIPEEDVAGVLSDLFGQGSDLNLLPTKLPLYDEGPHCNQRGLTDTGRYMLKQMVKRNIIYDVDHMSVKGASDALDELEKLKYSGVISSHTWTDPSAEPRVYALGGMVNPYAGGSEGYAGKWQPLQDKMDGRFFWGLGFGADMNGLGAQGGPRGADAENPVTYPFTGMGGVTIDKQVAGERVYDINVDGVAQYGLYPDWIEDLRQIAGNDIVKDLQRGPEAYLGMWERANGITNNACRQPELRRQASDFSAIKAGTSSDDVLAGFGQPHLRRDNTYRYCALNGDKDATVMVTFAGTSVENVSTGVKDEGTDTDPVTDPVTDPGEKPGNDNNAATGDDTPKTKAGNTDQALPNSGGPGLDNLILGLVAVLIGIAMVVHARRFRRGVS